MTTVFGTEHEPGRKTTLKIVREPFARYDKRRILVPDEWALIGRRTGA